jgi:hypothetical protein
MIALGFAAEVVSSRPATSIDNILARAVVADQYSDLGTDALGDDEWFASRVTSERAIHELIVGLLRFGGVIQDAVQQETAMSNTQRLAIEDAAAQVVDLINSRPVSPRQDEIEAIIARIHVPSRAASGREEPVITGPVQINYDVSDVADHWLPIAAMAVKLLAKDKADLQEFARSTFKGQIDGDVLGERAFHHFVDDLDVLEGKLRSLAHFVAVAKNRLALWVPL